jgi:hypothetical protein
MGYGSYSHEAHLALLSGREGLSRQEMFKQQGCHALMDPKGLKVRESRDAAGHPQALGIAFALDVTGSMGHIPEALAKKELPTFMKLLNECGIPDPQVLFMAVGDATSDRAPLQIGQFETTAELMDQWLTWSFLEGGGGPGNHESYELVFYALAQHTDLDCWAKRKQRGYLFMTGDELPYPAVSRHQVEALFGEKLEEDLAIEEVIAAAAETYNLFFLIPDLRRRGQCESRWRELLADQVICMESHEDTCAVAAGIVGLTERRLKDLDQLAKILTDQHGSRERIAAVIRALRPYADLLDAAAAGPMPTPSHTGAAPRPSWWKRLFD